MASRFRTKVVLSCGNASFFFLYITLIYCKSGDTLRPKFLGEGMTKFFIATLALYCSVAFAAPVCIVSELGSNDLQLSNAKTTKVALHTENDRLKEFGSVLFPEYSFKANHYDDTIYVGIYKEGKELARSGGKDWVQLVSKHPGRNPFGGIVVDCYSKDPSEAATAQPDTSAKPVEAGSSSPQAVQNGYNASVYNAGTYGTAPQGYYAASQSCPTGQVFTPYGCLPEAPKDKCPSYNGATYGWLNNTCVPVITSGPTTGYGYPGYAPQQGYYNSVGQCGQGQIMTQYNCLPMNPQVCGYNAGYLNGQCIPALQQGQYYNGYYYPYYYNGYNGYGSTGFYYGTQAQQK